MSDELSPPPRPVRGALLSRDDGAPSALTAAEALDAAFNGERCDMVRTDGSARTVPARRWAAGATAADLSLFVEPCVESGAGRTLDVGCGPGRLAGALSIRGVDVLGIDISAEAVRQTRARGAPAVRHDVFDELPVRGRWRHVLLADGNIGLGGRPVRLLRRIAELLARDGSALVELSGRGAVRVHENLHLRVGTRRTPPFAWATAGTEAIAEVAAAAGLLVSEVRYVAGRPVATLRHHQGHHRGHHQGRHQGHGQRQGRQEPAAAS